jgi:UDP:flavonoid glycosyltransferase YjiC (YdhE family)
MNSVNEAMYYGVPMLVMPVINDQPLNAAQVEKLKLGKKSRVFFISVTALYKQAMDVLSNQEIKKGCKNMENEIKSGINIDNICDLLEVYIN